MGEYGAGKSSLFRRFATNHFVTATDRASTMGLDNYGKVYQIGPKAIKLQVNFYAPLSKIFRQNRPAQPTSNVPQDLDPLVSLNIACFPAMGHWRHGACGLHHVVVLQIFGGRDPGLRPRQPRLLPHPQSTSPRHRDLCGKCKNLSVSSSHHFESISGS